MAKFLAKLVIRYDNYCHSNEIDPRNYLDMNFLRMAINEELMEHALEDLNCYGRLETLKESLVNLLDE